MNFPSDLDLRVSARNPTRLADETIARVLARPLPRVNIAAGSNAPRISILVVTFNKLVFTRLCLESILLNTKYSNWELVIVDNGSEAETKNYLRALADMYPNIQIIFNAGNRGFAAANNQALEKATGAILVFLNNDTIVPRGWLNGLQNHLQDKSIGLLGVITNRTCNAAQIETHYETYEELLQFADACAQNARGEVFEIPMVALFCAALRREVYEKIGALDERFQIGMFEDDDYSLRVKNAGYRVVCARDVFVHHFGQATLGEFAARGEYGKIFHANRRRFQNKWGSTWQPHARAANTNYDAAIQRLHNLIRKTLPPDSTILIASKGDDAFTQLEGYTIWHFPQNERGEYSGYYPADSVEAIGRLEVSRVYGGEFLIFPASARWWLEHYARFTAYVRANYPLILDDAETCTIFGLQEKKETDARKYHDSRERQASPPGHVSL